MQFYPTHPDFSGDPKLRLGTFLAEGGLAWKGKQRPNHFCLLATVYTHCPAPSPSLPPVPTSLLQRKPRSQKMPLTQKPMNLAPSPHSSSAEAGPTPGTGTGGKEDKCLRKQNKNINYLKKKNPQNWPWPGRSVGWSVILIRQGCWFDSWSRHKPITAYIRRRTN